MKNTPMEHNPIDNLSPSELARRLSEAQTTEGAILFQELIEAEQELSLLNLLKPYQDRVPLVLQVMDVESIVRLLRELDDYYIMKALFGNFRTVDEEKRQRVLAGLDRGKLALLLNRMSIGVDNPRAAASILRNLAPEIISQVADTVEMASVIRLLREMPAEHQGMVLASLRPERAAEIAEAILGAENAVRSARLAHILAQVDDPARRQVISMMKPDQARRVLEQMQLTAASRFDKMDPREIKLRCAEMTPEELAQELDHSDPLIAVEVLTLSDSWKAAHALTIMARDNPQSVADLLEEMNQKIIVGFTWHGRQRSCIEELYTCPAAAILGHLDLSLNSNINARGLIPESQMDAILERMPEDKRADIASIGQGQGGPPALPLSIQLFTVGTGTRRTTDLGRGLRWTRIEETLDNGERVKPVIVNLVEMDSRKIRIMAGRAITEDKLLPVDQVAQLIGDAKREGNRPDPALFTKLGLAQLGQMMRRTGAIAAINGNHYFDYGHYLDSIKLGIDPTQVPGLFFGDPVGWFVSDGTEVSHPAFNRASLVVTRDGNPHIERVFMTDVTLSNGTTVNWDETNVEKRDGLTILYNSLYGFKTRRSPSHMDIAIAKGQIVEIRPGGGGPIPLTGFVLAIHIQKSNPELNGVKVGDAVVVGNNFPSYLGEVEQAMACGPYLVSNGQMTISFEAEDFGEKDSSVMTFSLTRATETFEAARSFIMIRDNRLTIGTVSGRALGSGTTTESAGMAFGELAQLALDLRADSAYALDGGGSSSIVVRAGDDVRVLNTPTGGADVARGEERFINTTGHPMRSIAERPIRVFGQLKHFQYGVGQLLRFLKLNHLSHCKPVRPTGAGDHHGSLTSHCLKRGYAETLRAGRKHAVTSRQVV